MNRYLPGLSIVLAIGLTLVSGLIHGRMSNRWGPSQDLLAVGRKLEDFKQDGGSENLRKNWTLESSQKLSDDVVKVLQCVGHCAQTYKNQGTGQSVTVTLLVGPPGPLLVHPPEVCYGGAGYKQVKERRRLTVQDSEGSEHQFWTVVLQASDVTKGPLQVNYAWSTGGRWLAPAGGRRWAVWRHPRVTLSRYPYLYKIQVASPVSSDTDTDTENPCRAFLRDFVPVVKRYLVEPSGE